MCMETVFLGMRVCTPSTVGQITQKTCKTQRETAGIGGRQRSAAYPGSGLSWFRWALPLFSQITMDKWPESSELESLP